MMGMQKLRFSTHNVNGFNRHRDFLKSRCTNEPNTIQCIQEHWLRPPFKRAKGVNEFRHVHNDFDGYATSAMKESMKEKVLTGRPFGGTGFLWNKKFSQSLKPRVDYQHERVTVLELSNSCHNILCINVYMPYKKTSDIAEQKTVFDKTIGYIDHVISNNPDFKVILLGDFNCNLYDDNHPFTPSVRGLMQRRRLLSTFDLMDNFDADLLYTRRPFGGRGNGSLLDYVLISEELRNIASNVVIGHYPDNSSDHYPVSVDIELSITDVSINQPRVSSPSINWANVKDEARLQYANAMKVNLDSIVIPFRSLLHGKHCCDSNEHIFAIERYFSDIIDAISKADQLLPRMRPGISKDYWNSELTELKSASFDAFSIWRDAGKPSSGPIFDLKMRANYCYKLAVRKAKKLFDQDRSDEIHDDIIDGKSNKFWKSWKGLHGKKGDCTTRINGKIDSTDIANEFATNFGMIYNEANSDQAKRLSDEFESIYANYYETHVNDDLETCYLSWENMETVMAKLQPGKASGSLIKAEHILHGSPHLVIHLQLLFNSMIQHGYVPSDFLRGVITPIIKDAEGDSSSLDNYRGITLSHTFSYLFEHAVLIKIDPYLATDDLQFGYKKKHSTSHAIYTVKRCIDYFCDHGSHIYASFLDCTKGFDRVSHDGLFTKLIGRNVPYGWLRILTYWYSNLFSIVKWENAYSHPFRVISGVRQGGVLSAKFWALYMNDLVLLLRRTHKGCYMANLFLASILYADDLCLLAPSRSAMQKLLDTCSDYAQFWCIRYNEQKTKLMYFGKNYSSFTCHPLSLNDKPLEFVSEWKYLGVILQTGSGFSCSAKKPSLLKF